MRRMAGAGEAPRNVLMQMIGGCRISQAIHVAAVLGIADLLADGPLNAGELADTVGADADALYRVLRALAGVGIFAEADGAFTLTPLADYLRSDAQGSLRAWATFIGEPPYWQSWGHLLESVRTGQPAFPRLYGTTAWEYRAAHLEQQVVFDAAMTALSVGVVDAVVGTYDFSGLRIVADVGGGEGSLLATILTAYPALRGILFDQPQVVARARPHLEEAGVAQRCTLVGGSFFEEIPSGADAYLLKSIIHDWDDAAAVQILRRCGEAMGVGGRLLLVEPVILPGNDPDPAKLTDLNMLVMLGGRERTADDFRQLYERAGFALTRILPTGSGSAIIEGRPADMPRG